MKKILINTFGSFGDLYPYLAIGAELRRRGHRVTLASSALYQAKAEAEGLAFHCVRPDVKLDDREMLAYVMDAKRGSERIVRYLTSIARESYEDILDVAAEADLIVTHPITFAAVLAAQKLQVPWISTVLAPISLFSAYDPPVVSPAPWLQKLSVLGPKFNAGWMNLAKRHSLSWLQPVEELRRELGLPRGDNPLFEGQHSPSLVLALFSPLFASPQPDWPTHAVATGFPFFIDTHPLPPELERFLETGPAPIVFTLGSSAVGAARDFYRNSLEAVQRLGTRAVLLTGSHPQGLPATLPDEAIAIPYAPHAEVFARAAAIVHQGGIGTTAQGLRAGHPMLVVPFAHDQFDNAARVRRLGAGEMIPQARYTAQRAEAILRRLLSNPAYAASAFSLAAKIGAERGCNAAADAIEQSA